MIHAGVDIAKIDHVIAAVDEHKEELGKPMGFKNSAAGFERAISWLEGVAEEPKDVVVGMEATGHYWMACCAYLPSRSYAVCVINPLQVRAVRRLRGLSGVKNDRVDARLMAETLHMGQSGETRLATDEVQSLRTLSRYLQSLKAELAETKTQRVCLMDSCFSEFDGAFADMFVQGARAVLPKSPLPFEPRRRRQDSPTRDIQEASRRGEGVARGKAEELRRCAKASVGISLGQETASSRVRSLVRQMDFLDEECAKISKLVRGLPEEVGPLVLTIPGIPYTTGAQIVSEIGDISRSKDASAPVSHAGPDSSVGQPGKFDSGAAPSPGADHPTSGGQSGSRTAEPASTIRSPKPSTTGSAAREGPTGWPWRGSSATSSSQSCATRRPSTQTGKGRHSRRHSIFDSQGATCACLAGSKKLASGP